MTCLVIWMRGRHIHKYWLLLLPAMPLSYWISPLLYFCCCNTMLYVCSNVFGTCWKNYKWCTINWTCSIEPKTFIFTADRLNVTVLESRDNRWREKYELRIARQRFCQDIATTLWVSHVFFKGGGRMFPPYISFREYAPHQIILPFPLSLWAFLSSMIMWIYIVWFGVLPVILLLSVQHDIRSFIVLIILSRKAISTCCLCN